MIDLGIVNTNKVGATGRPGFNREVRTVDENGNNVKRGTPGVCRPRERCHDGEPLLPFFWPRAQRKRM